MVKKFEEIDVELLHEIITCNIISKHSKMYLIILYLVCGWELRNDDPASLKEIILLVQKTASEKGFKLSLSSNEITPVNETVSFSRRVQFMLQSIYDIKNNKQKLSNNSLADMKKLINQISAKKGFLFSSLFILKNI